MWIHIHDPTYGPLCQSILEVLVYSAHLGMVPVSIPGWSQGSQCRLCRYTCTTLHGDPCVKLSAKSWYTLPILGWSQCPSRDGPKVASQCRLCRYTNTTLYIRTPMSEYLRNLGILCPSQEDPKVAYIHVDYVDTHTRPYIRIPVSEYPRNPGILCPRLCRYTCTTLHGDPCV